MKDNIILIILFTSFSLILTEEIPLYNITNFEKISINNIPSACICIKMSDEIQKDLNFYIIISSNESNASINETLSYNYTESCPSSSCTDFEFQNQAECKISWDEDGFTYYYPFPKGDDKYMMIRYYQFTGNILCVEYTKSDIVNEFVATLMLYVGLISGSTIIILIILKFCWINKRINKIEENNDFIAPLFPEEKTKEFKVIQEDGAINDDEESKEEEIKE